MKKLTPPQELSRLKWILGMMSLAGIILLVFFVKGYCLPKPKPQPVERPAVKYFISNQDVTWEVASKQKVSNEFLASVCRTAGGMAQQAGLWESAKENYRLAKTYQKKSQRARCPR